MGIDLILLVVVDLIDAGAAIAGLLWVSEKKFLGGTYGFSVWPGVTNNALELPALQTNSKTSTGLADLYIQPVILGWNKARADFTAGLGIYAPTGEFEAGGDSNRGLRHVELRNLRRYDRVFRRGENLAFCAATAFYETHGKKDDTDIRVGDILTLEGGLGKSFMEGAASVGVAYYAQWKLTDERFWPRFYPTRWANPRQAPGIWLWPRGDVTACEQVEVVRFFEPALFLGDWCSDQPSRATPFS